MRKLAALAVITAMLIIAPQDSAALSFGDRGSEVSILQLHLHLKGYMQEKHITGYFGEITKSAVKSFQKDMGLERSGNADDELLLLLKNEKDKPSAAEDHPDEQPAAAAIEQYSQVTYVASLEAIRPGQTGDIVKQVQDRLKSLGYLDIKNTTRYYGELTTGAVLAFQYANGIAPTGIIEPSCYALLMSADARSFVAPEPEIQILARIEAPGYTSEAIDVSSVISAALSRVGKPYKYGSRGPDSFDCSGLVYYSYLQTGIKLPPTSAKQAAYENCAVISDTGSLLPGDIVCFNTSGKSWSVNHTGIYIGNGDFVHSSSGAKKVQINNLSDGFYKESFRWAVRVSG